MGKCNDNKSHKRTSFLIRNDLILLDIIKSDRLLVMSNKDNCLKFLSGYVVKLLIFLKAILSNNTYLSQQNDQIVIKENINKIHVLSIIFILLFRF